MEAGAAPRYFDKITLCCMQYGELVEDVSGIVTQREQPPEPSLLTVHRNAPGVRFAGIDFRYVRCVGANDRAG